MNRVRALWHGPVGNLLAGVVALMLIGALCATLTGCGGGSAEAAPVPPVVIVPPPPPPPALQVTFAAAPDTVTAGAPVALEWTSNADYCVLSGGQFTDGAPRAGSGTANDSPQADTTYSIDCARQTAPDFTSATAAVTVLPAPPPFPLAGAYVSAGATASPFYMDLSTGSGVYLERQMGGTFYVFVGALHDFQIDATGTDGAIWHAHATATSTRNCNTGVSTLTGDLTIEFDTNYATRPVAVTVNVPDTGWQLGLIPGAAPDNAPACVLL